MSDLIVVTIIISIAIVTCCFRICSAIESVHRSDTATSMMMYSIYNAQSEEADND